MMTTTFEDKIVGCMVGGAVGDALGYPVEFSSRESILKKYGPGGIRLYERRPDGVAEISDDTQMSLYTAAGLLIDDIEGAYLEWLATQSYGSQPITEPRCAISRLPELYSLRAPGNTCLSALRAIRDGRTPHNDSKGCGGIMRVAPIALFHTPCYYMDNSRSGLTVDKVARLACEAARITHHHPLGYLPAGALAGALLMILEETQKREIDGDFLTGEKRITITRQELAFCIRAAIRAIRYLCCCTHDYDADAESEELMLKTMRAIELADSDTPDADAIRELGEGWTGDEAWYIAVFCSLRHFDSFEDAVAAAVNHTGDSDSTGAITGNIMGAVYGYRAIPEHFKKGLELHDTIVEMAQELYKHDLEKQ